MREDGRRLETEHELCPECKGRGMVRAPGEWSNETCPTCEGRGRVLVAKAPGTKIPVQSAGS